MSDLLADTAAALVARRRDDAREGGLVLADALEEYGYQTLAERVREAVTTAGGYLWDILQPSIQAAIAQIASGQEPELRNEYMSQGYAPVHRASPYHQILTNAGYSYSHTSRLFHGSSRYDLHHTYVKEGEPPISVATFTSEWSSRVPAFRGRRGIGGSTPAELEKYLRGKAHRKARRP